MSGLGDDPCIDRPEGPTVPAVYALAVPVLLGLVIRIYQDGRDSISIAALLATLRESGLQWLQEVADAIEQEPASEAGATHPVLRLVPPPPGSDPHEKSE